jgi:hypothetical protein
MTSKAPKMPEVAKPVPIPQTDSPEMVAVQQKNRADMANQEGTQSSLLTGTTGVQNDSNTTKKKLGLGSISY